MQARYYKQAFLMVNEHAPYILTRFGVLWFLIDDDIQLEHASQVM